MQPTDAPGTVSGWYTRARKALRGSFLLMLGWPLVPEAISELARGRLEPLAGAIGAGALLIAAFMQLRRAPDRKTTWRAGGMVGLASLLLALLNAEYGLGISLVFALAAGFGTVMAYGPARETVLPDLADLKPPLPAPPPDPETIARQSLESRTAALVALPRTMPGEFGRAVARVGGLAQVMLAEARDDPADFSRIRRFLGVYLDQLETLVVRFRAAYPRATTSPADAMPASLGAVLADLERAFEQKLVELRLHDLKALDVEREVLARRLSEQLAPQPAPHRTPQESPR
jgi:hypothetical protein